MLAHGSEFLYNNGFLCYIHDDELRVLDVHGAGQVEQVLNITNTLTRVFPGDRLGKDSTVLTLSYFNDGIVAFLVELRSEVYQAWLIAVDLHQKHNDGVQTGRLRLKTRLRSTRKLFVRHNGSYLYYGTHSVVRHRGWSRYGRWAISCVDLRSGQHMTKNPIVMEDFAGAEIGQTVCFEIHHDSLFGVSNVFRFENEEVDWTSFYMWFCLSPSEDMKEAKLHRIWRRQHREGPINDTWNDFSLRIDEATGGMVILECRREWKDGGSENCRTYYTQPLPPTKEIIGKKNFSQNDFHRVPTAHQLPDEPLTRTLDSTNKPNYEPPRKRLRRYYHAEYQLGTEGGDKPCQKQDFILANTKYRTYHLSALAFVDLVNDPVPDLNNKLAAPQDRLRIRTVSRKRKSPIDYDGEEGKAGYLFKPEIRDENDKPVDKSEERFVSRGIRLWPSDDAPRELIELLCPSKRAGKVRAVADERSIVYSVDQRGKVGNQAIVLISFDPLLRFKYIKRLGAVDFGGMSPSQEGVNSIIGIKRPRIGDCSGGQMLGLASASGTIPPNTERKSECVWEEPAMHLSINRGYWVR